MRYKAAQQPNKFGALQLELRATMAVQVSAYHRSQLRALEPRERADTSSESRQGLLELVRDVTSARVFSRQREDGPSLANLSSCWLSRDPDRLYAIALLRKCITTELRLLCSGKSAAPLDDTCRELAEAAETFNKFLTPAASSSDAPLAAPTGGSFPQRSRLSFGDFVDVLVSFRSEHVADCLLHQCRQVADILSMAREETLFIHSLLSSFNSQSSLLTEFSDSHFPASSDGPTSQPLSYAADESVNRKAVCLGKSVLERLELVVASEMWKQVAVCVRHGLASGECKAVRDLLREAAQTISQDRGLEAAAKCLIYVAKRQGIEEELMCWDKGFQSMLASTQRPLVASKRSLRPVDVFCREVLPPLQRAISLAATDSQSPTARPGGENSYQMTVSQLILSPLTLSIHSIASALMTTIELSLAKCDLPELARGIFCDGPQVYRSVCGIKETVCHSLPANLSLQDSPGACIEGKMIETRYSKLLETFSHICDEFERVCVEFHDLLRGKSRQCLQSVFPSARHWGNIRKQKGVGEMVQPSSYCEVVVEQLLMPITEAALPLEDEGQAQWVFLALSLSIFYTEYRKTILQHRHTYSVCAGRQLVADYNHLQRWLTSGTAGLAQETVRELASLAVVQEMERGLQALCGFKIPESDHDSGRAVVCGEAPIISGGEWVQGFSSLPLWSEIAWHRPSDWQLRT